MAQLLGLCSKEGSPYLLFYLFHCFLQGRVQLEQGSLTITNVSLSDAGMYQCVAENRHGIIFASAELSVIGKCTFLSAANLPKQQSLHPSWFCQVSASEAEKLLRIFDNLFLSKAQNENLRKWIDREQIFLHHPIFSYSSR